MKNLINELAEKVMNTEGSFTIDIQRGIDKDYTNYIFLQCKVGKARYIYSSYTWNDSNYASRLDIKPELVAIVVDNLIYIYDDYKLDLWSKDIKNDLPDNIVFMDKLLSKENDRYLNVIFKTFYDKLDSYDITDKYELINCKKDARSKLFRKDFDIHPDVKDLAFAEDDIAKYLCGIIDLDAEANARLNHDIDHWKAFKSYKITVEKLSKCDNICQPYELQIANGLNNVDAKLVSVTFTYNGKTSSAKIDPDKILNHLISNDDFDSYDFDSYKHGEQLFKELEVPRYYSDKNEEKLTCNSIDKIVYGKKILYEK